MKKILASFVLGTLCLPVLSQSIEDFKVSDGRVNDAQLVDYVMENRYPGYNDYMDSWYHDISEQVKTMSSFETGSRSTLKIPVVVHIVWKNSVENIALSDIEDQIDILNRDFNRQNSDSVNLRSTFQSIAGNPKIEFVLRHVERVNTTSDFTFSFTSLYDDIKHSSSGGSDAWTTSHYLNIWVGRLQGDFLLGYAYPPAGAPGWPGGQSAPTPGDDGVVIDYRAFGPFTNFGGIFLRGRTSVHEVGHYLGLRHIWGDGDCSQDDNLSDTPKADSESQQNCDKTRNTCNEGTGDLPDLVENYMDYSSESCQNMFTKQQASTMRTVLQTYRPNLIPTAGLDEINQDFNFDIYPNPSNGLVNYTIDESINESVSIEIIDISGKTVLSKSNLSTTGTFDLSSFNKGVYLVRIHGAQLNTTRRITLQ